MRDGRALYPPTLHTYDETDRFNQMQVAAQGALPGQQQQRRRTQAVMRPQVGLVGWGAAARV